MARKGSRRAGSDGVQGDGGAAESKGKQGVPQASSAAGGAGGGVRFDRPRTSDLILPGGMVDKRALYRAAEEELRVKRDAHADPGKAITDEDYVDEGSGLASGEVVAGGLGVAGGVEDVETGEEEIAPQRVRFKLKRDLNKRLDRYLVDRITFMSRAKLQAVIEAGGVTVNGREAKSSTMLREGNLVEVLIPPPPSAVVRPEAIALDVMYEDEQVIVVNKSPDIIVHPARAHNTGTMINALAYHFAHGQGAIGGGKLSDVGKELARPGVIHRLDRQTSGAIVFAKTEQSHWQVARQFELRSVDKRYVAVAHGRVGRLQTTFDEPMGPAISREKGHREKQIIRHDGGGKPAITIARVLGYFTIPATDQRDRARLDSRDAPAGRMWATLLEIELKTGRTHQIRVHCAHHGHPLIADEVYGGVVLEPSGGGADAWPGMGRVALHAALLRFRHPTTNEGLRFVAPLAPDLREFVRAMRASPGGEEPAEVAGRVLTLDGLLA